MPVTLLSQEGCDEKVSVKIRADQGHPWRPPFGVARVGSPITVHAELTGSSVLQGDFYLTAIRSGREIERRPLKITGDKSPFFGHEQFDAPPDAVAFFVRWPSDARPRELARQAVKWPEVEAEAVARPDRQINPVDLGTVLVPHDWLLLVAGQTAVIDVAVISRTRNLPSARLRAWFEGGQPLEVGIPLVIKQRVTKELRLPLTVGSDRTVCA